MNNEKCFGFVHVPKTGNTSLINFFYENYSQFCSPCINPIPHSCISSDIDKRCKIIVSIRDPLDRFLSSYNYYLYGSEKYHAKKPIFYREKNINLFITNILPIIHKTSFHDVLGKDYLWNVHFLPQSFWLKKEDYSRTIILKYRKNWSSIIGILTEYLNIPHTENPVPHTNITKKKRQINIRKKIKYYIDDFYAQDYVLLQAINTNPSIFMKVI